VHLCQSELQPLTIVQLSYLCAVSTEEGCTI
jgi:hypothetical protein